MIMFKIIFFYIILSIYFCNVISQDNSTEDGDDDDFVEFDEKGSYCFRFTWLGPKYDNSTNLSPDANCKKIMEDKKLTDVPCKQPLVITDDGTTPNFAYLLENHRDQVLCPRKKQVSCVKYSYYFNGQIQNVTYMCAKVSALNEGEVTSGCWTEYDEDGLETEVCVCKPIGNIPCNNSSVILGNLLMIFHIFILIYIKYY